MKVDMRARDAKLEHIANRRSWSILFLLLALALLTLGATKLFESTRTAKDVWVSECEKTYGYASCYRRWDEAHPMPADYGFGGKAGAP